MKSATTELLKYFERKGIQCLGNPYIAFEDIEAGPAETTEFIAGKMVLMRITTRRWFIQWWRLRRRPADFCRAAEIIALLEDVVQENRPIDVVACEAI